MKAASASRDAASNERDVIGSQVVGMGRRASEATREWFALLGCDRPLLHLQQTARRSKESVNRFRLSYRKEDPCDVVA